MASDGIDENGVHRLGVLRLALTGALAGAIFYALCWIGALVPTPSPVTHMYLRLFTDAELSSAAALLQGLLWSLVAGLAVGALVAFIYNALAALDRR